MKNILLSVVVVATLIAAGVGGTFAGFVDTEVSSGNYVQAGITDLLINGKNDADCIGAKLVHPCLVPDKSIDFWVDALNWGTCTGGRLFIHFKDVDSYEAGAKYHDYQWQVYSYNGSTHKYEYRPRIPGSMEPQGPGVWSSEPEKISENGSGLIGQYWIAHDDPNLLGEDYASGVAQHLDIRCEVPYVGTIGTILGNPDLNDDGSVNATEFAAWTTAGNRWVTIVSGKLSSATVDCNKTYAGILFSQCKTFFHIDVVLQQIYADEWGTVNYSAGTWTGAGVDYDGDGGIDTDDLQKAGWPTNALHGDIATWDMMFELLSDP
jgi:hypothetical protein